MMFIALLVLSGWACGSKSESSKSPPTCSPAVAGEPCFVDGGVCVYEEGNTMFSCTCATAESEIDAVALPGGTSWFCSGEPAP
jgi:hypothetical protein